MICKPFSEREGKTPSFWLKLAGWESHQTSSCTSPGLSRGISVTDASATLNARELRGKT